MNAITQDQAIDTTRSWLEKVIVQYNFCPFARREMLRDSIVYYVEHSNDVHQQLSALIKQCERMSEHKTIETLLLIYPYCLQDFDAYLDYLAVAEQLLVEQGYEGIYQLASFHPDYCFSGASLDDPANYTNRSPYPMLHIIREASIDRVLASYPEPEKIPQRNIEIAHKLGSERMQDMLEQCKK